MRLTRGCERCAARQAFTTEEEGELRSATGVRDARGFRGSNTGAFIEYRAGASAGANPQKLRGPPWPSALSIMKIPGYPVTPVMAGLVPAICATLVLVQMAG